MVAIIGHRGARNLWPENSLDGFRRTLALGIDGVEFDVHRARCGTPVVIHDPTLERTTKGRGAVASHSAAELALIGVPSLEMVLDVFAGSTMELHIEIKTDALGRPYEGLERLLIELIARRGLQGHAILTCFVPEVLETVRQLSPAQRILGSLDRRSAELFGGLPRALDRFAAIDDCLLAVERSLLADSLDVCRQRLGGERLGAWVTNEPDDIAFWLAQPIRQITTDRPDLALARRSMSN